MRVLHLNECEEWCREHGTAVGDGSRLAADVGLSEVGRIDFAPSGSVGLEAAAVGACLLALEPYDEAMLWIVEWGIWPSSEDWPRFYAARGRHGERQSLEDKPGHLFLASEPAELREFLRLVLDQGWGGHVLAGRHGRIDRRLWVSHDGWISLNARSPMAFVLSAV